MDLLRVLVWACLMLLIGLLLSSMDMTVFVAHLQTWWLTALVGAILIYYVPHWTADPDENPYWLLWMLCMAVYLTGYGLWMDGTWMGVTLWWHWGVALMSALVMHYAAPWARRYLPA